MAKDISSEVRQIFEEYNREAIAAIRDAIEEQAEETAAELRSTSRGKKYPKGWKAKVESGSGAAGVKAAVYNSAEPGLTHLLEKGHMIVNQYGTYGRVNGDGVIADAQAKAEAALISKIERVL